jgi:hypothetical protein
MLLVWKEAQAQAHHSHDGFLHQHCISVTAAAEDSLQEV